MGMIQLSFDRKVSRCIANARSGCIRKKKLQARRPERKKVSAAERQPLFRPSAPDEVWSMDFVFDRTADERVIEWLTMVDYVTH